MDSTVLCVCKQVSVCVYGGVLGNALQPIFEYLLVWSHYRLVLECSYS